MSDGSSDTWTSQQSSTDLKGHARYRNWNNTVGFALVPKDDRPVNGYEDVNVSWEQNPVSQQIYYIVGGAVYSDQPNIRAQAGQIAAQMISDRSISQSDWDSRVAACRNEARVKVLGKMADAKTNLAVVYAEAHKTSELILTTANRLFKAYEAFRKGNLKGIAENLGITPKKLHNTWLEYKYGWLPLIMDVKGAAEFFAQQNNRDLIRRTKFRVTSSTSVSHDYSRSINYGPIFGVPPDWSDARVLTRQGTIKLSIWCELTNEHYSELQQLGLTNPALFVWEVIPFSFVFDWFCSVGDYLTAISAFHGVTVLRACESFIDLCDFTVVYPAATRVDATYRYVQNEVTRSFGERHYTRAPWSPNPVDLNIPVVNHFDYQKLVTSLALLRGNVRRPGWEVPTSRFIRR